MRRPEPTEVRAAREAAQVILGVGITAAQDWCAHSVHTQRRPWQQWETGDRSMHPAFWELFGIKFAALSEGRGADRGPARMANAASSRNKAQRSR